MILMVCSKLIKQSEDTKSGAIGMVVFVVLVINDSVVTVDVVTASAVQDECIGLLVIVDEIAAVSVVIDSSIDDVVVTVDVITVDVATGAPWWS
jgi:hypothetical protein